MLYREWLGYLENVMSCTLIAFGVFALYCAVEGIYSIYKFFALKAHETHREEAYRYLGAAVADFLIAVVLTIVIVLLYGYFDVGGGT